MRDYVAGPVAWQCSSSARPRVLVSESPRRHGRIQGVREASKRAQEASKTRPHSAGPIILAKPICFQQVLRVWDFSENCIFFWLRLQLGGRITEAREAPKRAQEASKTPPSSAGPILFAKPICCQHVIRLRVVSKIFFGASTPARKPNPRDNRGPKRASQPSHFRQIPAEALGRPQCKHCVRNLR